MLPYDFAPYEEKMIKFLAEKWDCTPAAAVYMSIKLQYDAYCGPGAGSKLFTEWLETKK